MRRVKFFRENTETILGKDMAEKPIGYVLIHEARLPYTMAFDVFARKDVAPKYRERLKNILYEMKECSYVKDFLKENPDYEYIGSEDFVHHIAVNVSYIELIAKLYKEGFEII